ncbi:unnamed protein product [Aphanomyces euteiches]
MSPLVLMGIVTIPGFLSLLIPSLVKHRNAQDTLKKLLMQIIHDKLASPATENPKDLLDMILPHATTDEAVSHTLTFMVAGHDTSSSSLGFIFGTLASHPEAISAIRAEYKRVVSKYGSLTTWEAIAELEYTHAVIQETLRLNAVTFGAIPRTTLENDNVPMSDGSTVFIPKGTSVQVYMGAMHRNSKYWSNPNMFIPERFIEGTPEWNVDLDLRDGKAELIVLAEKLSRRPCPSFRVESPSATDSLEMSSVKLTSNDHLTFAIFLTMSLARGIILTCLANVVMAEDDEGRTIRVLCFILLGIFVVVSAAACFVQWSSCLPQNDRSKAILSPQKGHEDESELRIAIASPSNEQA